MPEPTQESIQYDNPQQEDQFTTIVDDRDLAADPEAAQGMDTSTDMFTDASLDDTALTDAPVMIDPMDFSPIDESSSGTAVLAENYPATSAITQDPPVSLQASTAQIQSLDGYLDYLGELFNAYSRPIAIILIALVSVILALAFLSSLLSALNLIPLLSPLLKLIGLGFTVWFVRRYVLFAPNRQELLRQIESWKQRIVGQS